VQFVEAVEEVLNGVGGRVVVDFGDEEEAGVAVSRVTGRENRCG